MNSFTKKVLVVNMLFAFTSSIAFPLSKANDGNNITTNNSINNIPSNIQNEIQVNAENNSNINEENSISNISNEKNTITEINTDQDIEIESNSNNNIDIESNDEETINKILSLNSFISKINTNGIYIQSEISENVLKILNFNSIYTYSIDENGKLNCNYLKKNNEYLDIDAETEVDTILKKFSTDPTKKIIIINNDSLLKNKLSATEVYENSEYKFILLNSSFFPEELVNSYHPSLSDYILKGISYDQYSISTTSSFATTGKSSSSQVVYFGPSTENYAEIGSVNWHEVVQIIGMNKDWYHITYEIGKTGNYKTGYLPKSKVINASGPDLYEEQLIGGYRVANQKIYVKSYDIKSQSVDIGTVFESEGITCLYDYTNSDGENVSYIEFSTGTGTKRGYVDTSSMSEPINYYENGHHFDTTVGYVKYDVNLSMGVGSGYVNKGLALSKDEYVAVLGKENNNLYVEYNTKSGRKRAFTTTDYIELTRHYTNGVLNWYADLPVLYGQKVSNVSQTVYGTPSAEGASIGSIDQGEAVYVYMNHKFNDANNTYSYIAYNTSGGKKTGYIPSNTLSNFTQVNLPEFKDFEGAEKTIVRSAGDVNGNNAADMAFYKVGTGENRLYLVFNQHGWEDAYPGDGVELTRISQKFLTELTDSTHSDILEKWTIYVMCDANPNGILNGEDHQGVGRTVPYSGVDMNRAWPTNSWTPSSTTTKGKKGYTGSNPVENCLELKQVKSLLEANAPNSRYRSILIDIHGWDCETIGDEKIGNYYNTADTFSSTTSGINFFSKLYNHGFQHRTSFGEGYLATWAKQKLKTDFSIILELPYPQDSSTIATADNTTIQKYDFAGRFITGTFNLLNNEAIK